MYAHYGLWDRTPWGAGYWTHWQDGGHNPDIVLSNGWERDTMALPNYPLCGIYDCGNIQIDLWNIRLAKATGITAFFVEGLWPGLDYLYTTGFTNMMLAAEQENFKIAMDVWGPNYQSGDLSTMISDANAVLKKWKDSPAYLHIDEKPVYLIDWLGAPSSWFTPADLVTFKSGVEAAIGEPIYIIWSVTGFWAKWMDLSDPSSWWIPVSWWSCPAVDSFYLYASWSINGAYQFGTFTIAQWQYEYTVATNLAHQYGKKFIFPIAAGTDNREMGGVSYVSREGGAVYQTQIDAIKSLNFTLDGISVSDWNDFGEQWNIMPSITDFNDWTSPYQYLNMSTQLTGSTFHIPLYPPVDSIDPAFQSKFIQEMNAYPPS